MNRFDKFRRAVAYYPLAGYFAILSDDDMPDGYGDPQPQSFVLSPSGEEWSAASPNRYEYANVDWRGDAGVLTWWGPACRYWYGRDFYDPMEYAPRRWYPGQVYLDQRETLYTDTTVLAFGTEIYQAGVKLDDAPNPVLGAAIAKSTNHQWLIAVCANVIEFDQFGGTYYYSDKHICYAKKLADPAAIWMSVAEFDHPSPVQTRNVEVAFMNTWCFSASGAKAASIQTLWDANFNTVANLVKLSLSATDSIVTGSFVSEAASSHTQNISTTPIVTQGVTWQTQGWIWANPSHTEVTFTGQTTVTGASSLADSISFLLDEQETLAVDFDGEELVELKSKWTESCAGTASYTNTPIEYDYTYDGQSYTMIVSLSPSGSMNSTLQQTMEFWFEKGGVKSHVINNTATETIDYEIVITDQRILTDYINEMQGFAMGLTPTDTGDGNTYAYSVDVSSTGLSHKPSIMFADCRTKSASFQRRGFFVGAWSETDTGVTESEVNSEASRVDTVTIFPVGTVNYWMHYVDAQLIATQRTAFLTYPEVPILQLDRTMSKSGIGSDFGVPLIIPHYSPIPLTSTFPGAPTLDRLALTVTGGIGAFYVVFYQTPGDTWDIASSVVAENTAVRPNWYVWDGYRFSVAMAGNYVNGEQLICFRGSGRFNVEPRIVSAHWKDGVVTLDKLTGSFQTDLAKLPFMPIIAPK